jgi:hypothetical protein
MRDDESVRSGGTDNGGGAGVRTAADVRRGSKGSSSKGWSGRGGSCTLSNASNSPPALTERSAPAALSKLRKAGGAARGMGAFSGSSGGRAFNRAASAHTLTSAALEGGGAGTLVGAAGLGADGGSNPFGPPADRPAGQVYTPMDAGARAQMSATRDAAIERMWADQEHKVRGGEGEASLCLPAPKGREGRRQGACALGEPRARPLVSFILLGCSFFWLLFCFWRLTSRPSLRGQARVPADPLLFELPARLYLSVNDEQHGDIMVSRTPCGRRRHPNQANAPLYLAEPTSPSTRALAARFREGDPVAEPPPCPPLSVRAGAGARCSGCGRASGGGAPAA